MHRLCMQPITRDMIREKKGKKVHTDILISKVGCSVSASPLLDFEHPWVDFLHAHECLQPQLTCWILCKSNRWFHLSSSQEYVILYSPFQQHLLTAAHKQYVTSLVYKNTAMDKQRNCQCHLEFWTNMFLFFFDGPLFATKMWKFVINAFLVKGEAKTNSNIPRGTEDREITNVEKVYLFIPSQN